MNNTQYQEYLEQKAVRNSPAIDLMTPVVSDARQFKEGRLTEDNIHVHGLWIGTALSKLELLTIHSFIKNGHQFHLWVYDKIETPLPVGTILEDANEIIPVEKVFRYKNVNKYGHGKGSVSGFSDIFRYKLLYDKGGWWVDMDVTCLKPLNVRTPYFFRKHHELALVGNVMKCPAGAELMMACYKEASAEVTEDNTDWHKPIEILNKYVAQYQLTNYIFSNVSNQDLWMEIIAFVIGGDTIPGHYRFIHWMNEEWRSRDINKNDIRYRSTLGQIMMQAGLLPEKDTGLKNWMNEIRHLLWLRIYYYSR